MLYILKVIINKIKRSILVFPRSISFFQDLLEYKNKSRSRLLTLLKEIRPCLSDNTPTTDFDTHYVNHIAWAIREILVQKPLNHIDISSSLFFNVSISAYIPTTFYDFRPAKLKMSGLNCLQADITDLKFPDSSISSLSCMHVVEHIGLGRYGDSIDADGDIKAIANLKRVLSPNGNLYFVVPVGKRKVHFNAHRVYDPEEIIELFKEYTLIDFSIVPDPKYGVNLIANPNIEFVKEQEYACGCFHFKKLP